jgi:hypothetical protein
MKHLLHILITVLFLTFMSCENVEEDPDDYYPKVKTLWGNYLGYGTLEVVGYIDDNGYTPINLAGFCLSDTGIPEMLDNQLHAMYYSNDTFAAIYQGDFSEGQYNLRSWAVNDNTYSYGDVISIDIEKTPVVYPCNPISNYIDFDGFSYGKEVSYCRVEINGAYKSTWNFYATAYPGGLDLTFGSRPTTGIYFIKEGSELEYNEVSVEFRTINSEYSLKEGSKVYVNEYKHNYWTVTICNAQWSDGISNYLTAQFSCSFND